ncbi:MAG: hypothetical protein K0Q58_1591 [Microbacterium sp.]|nr:hypothetical protein [Microbacterium sp.]
MPAHRQHAVGIRGAVLGEVGQDGARRVAEPAGGMRRDLGDHADPERGRGGEAVDEAPPLEERGAVAADELERVGEEAVEAGDVAGGAVARELRGAGHPRPQDRVHVQRPAHVVVVRALVAVGEPSVLADEGVVPGEVGGDVVGGPRSADRAQEGLHDEPEPHPVRLGVGVVADDRGEVVDDAGLGQRVEAVPDPRAGEVEDQGDRGGLDLRLGVLVHPHPAIRGLGVDAGRDAAGVEIDQVVDALAASTGDAESGEQERAGESFEAVDGRAVAAFRAGELDASRTGRRVTTGDIEQRVGVGEPLVAAPGLLRADAARHP